VPILAPDPFAWLAERVLRERFLERD
jgi:hypothetical protein